MTITIFVQPESLSTFINTTKILKELPLENNYVFTPSDIIYTEAMISNYIWVNMEIDEYLKFKYCYNKLKNNG